MITFPDPVLLTKDDLKKLPTIAEVSNVSDPICYVHLFGGPCDWYIMAYDPEDEIAFALCDLGMGYREAGDVYLPEIAAIRLRPLGTPIERDRYFEPAPVSKFQK